VTLLQHIKIKQELVQQQPPFCYIHILINILPWDDWKF